MKIRIYLDNNATTIMAPNVSDVIVRHLNSPIGNPSSIHSFGREARSILQESRRSIAKYLGVKPNETIFTSGATEGLNMVIQGFLAIQPKGHVITSAVEHSCVYSLLKKMETSGWSVSFLSPGLCGAVTPEAVQAAIRPDTKLIALMAVNNETGVKTDIDNIALIAEHAGISFVVDGVALLGKETFTIPSGVSAMCFSGHKLHAPAGIGVCFLRSNLKLPPLFIGGEQEFQRRGGTENLLGIVGMAEAIKCLEKELPAATERMRFLRDRFEVGILSSIPGTFVNGSGPRVANTSNIAFNGLDGESLLAALDMKGVAVSHGSACSSGALEPSRVLLNMGLSREVARSSLRISLSRFTTEEEIDEALQIFVEVTSRQIR